MDETHAHHETDCNAWLTPLAIGAALITGAFMLSPYVLPLVGVGNAKLAEESMSALHGTGLGNGLAGIVNRGINAIPAIGGALAKGGWATAAASGVTGIGGTLLGAFIENKRDGKQGINWGKVIRYAALATSALVALPTFLTGISTAIVYLSAAFSATPEKGVELASSAVTFLTDTVGSVGAMNATATGLAGAAASLPHLIACCTPLMPFAVSMALAGKKTPAPYQPVNKKLLADDPNHQVTAEQKALVDAYNAAPAIKKPLLQRWFKDNGYNPDFHADGTMHLHQHVTAMSR